MNLFQTPLLVVPTYRKNEHIRNQHIGKYARMMINLLDPHEFVLRVHTLWLCHCLLGGSLR